MSATTASDSAWVGVKYENADMAIYKRHARAGVRLVSGTQVPIVEDQQVHTYIPNQTPDSRYTINENGTVTDDLTGLIWQRCSLGQTLTGTSCEGRLSLNNWAQALQKAEDNSFANYNDWRLPNVKELLSLAAHGRYNPAINNTVFPNTDLIRIGHPRPVMTMTAHFMFTSLMAAYTVPNAAGTSLKCA